MPSRKSNHLQSWSRAGMNRIDQECTPFGPTQVTLEAQCFGNGPGLGGFERTGVNKTAEAGKPSGG